MKRIFSVLFALFMALGCTSLGGVFLTGCGKQKTETKGDNSVSAAASGNWSSYYASSYAGGSGTSSSPYLISTPEQLARVAYRVNSGYETSSYFKLTNNIDLSAHYWTPIGVNKSFSGCFDGLFNTINGLTINTYYTSTIDWNSGQTTRLVGFFGWVSDKVKIQNINFSNANFNWSAPNSSDCLFEGFVCATSIGSSEPIFENIKVLKSEMKFNVLTFSNAFVGGIAGAGWNLTINKCSLIECKITAGSSSSKATLGHVGGIVGKAYGSGTISNCFLQGGYIDVYCASYGGGILGFAEGSYNILSSYFQQKSSQYAWLGSGIAGGICGILKGGSYIKSCFVDAVITQNSVSETVTKSKGSIVGRQEGGFVYYCQWYGANAPNTAYGSKTGGTITGCSGYSSQGLPKSDIAGSFYRSSSYLNGTGTNGSEWKTTNWMYDPSQNNGYPILIFSNAAYPISFDYNFSGVNVNLFNMSMITDSANLTYSSGRWTTQAVSGNTYSWLKLHKLQNGNWDDLQAGTTVNAGRFYHTITKTEANCYVRTGFNGDKADATIIIDISSLQNGDYTVSVNVFNYVVGSSGSSFGELKIEKGTSFTGYTEPARDKKVGETYGTLPTYSSRTGYTLGNWYRKKNYLDMDAMMNYINSYQSESKWKMQKDADGTYSWCGATAYTDNGYRTYPVSLTIGGTYRLSYLARDSVVGEAYSTSLAPRRKDNTDWYGNAYNDCYVIRDTTWRWYETTFTVGSDFGGFSCGNWYGDERTYFKHIRLERIDVEDAEATVYSTTAQPKMAGHKLYARWSPNTYTVSFNANGGTGTMSSRTWSYDTWYSVSNSFSRTGYTFSGWQISTGSSVTHYYGTSTSSYSTTTNTTWTYNNAGTSYFKNLRSSSGTVNMYAQWTPNTYTVSFDAPNLWEEYSSSTSSASANFSHRVDDFGQKVTTCEITEYSGGGVYFSKERLTVGERYVWKVDLKSNKSHTIKTIGHEQGAFESLNVNSNWQTLTHEFVAGDTTYNAFVIYDGLEVGEVLQVANLTIQKKSDISGDGAIESLKKSFGKSYGFLPTPTRVNYTFSGWWTDPSGGTQITSTSTYTTVGNQTLYAHWTPKQVTVNVYLRVIPKNGGSATASTAGGTVKVEGYQISGASSSFVTLTTGQTSTSSTYYVHEGQNFRLTASPTNGYVFAGVTSGSTPSPTAPVDTVVNDYPYSTSTTTFNYYVYFKQVSENQLKYDETDKYFYFEDGYYPQSEATETLLEFDNWDRGWKSTLTSFVPGQRYCLEISLDGTISDYGNGAIVIDALKTGTDGGVDWNDRKISCEISLSSLQQNKKCLTSFTASADVANTCDKVLLWFANNGGEPNFSNAKIKVKVYKYIDVHLSQSATANGEKFTYNNGSQNVDIPVYTYNNEKYVKIEKSGTTKWFKFEPIRWRISDYGVEKTETNYIKYEALRKYTGYATNFTAVSDLILGVGAMHNTREVREGTSVTSMKGFQLVEETTDGCSITFQYAKSGNVIKVDNYSTSSQNNAVSTGTTAYSAPLRIASLEEITSLGLVNKGARASDMVAFILGVDKNQVTYWTRDLSNLGSGVAITSTGTKVQTWLNQLQGMRFAYTFSEGSNVGGVI